MSTSLRPEAAKVTVSGRTPNGDYTDETCDAWELKASRRALKNLRTLLHGEPMRELLRAQIEEHDAKIRDVIAASNGEFLECRIDMDVEGFTATQMMQEQMARMQQSAGPSAKDDFVLNLFYPMHPEHYAVPPYESGGVIETTGGLPTRARLVNLQFTELPEFAQKYADEAYPYKQCARGELDDGSVCGYILHEYRDTPTGAHLIFRGLFPAATPQIYFDDHYEHFAVEFRNHVRNLADRAQASGAA